jgi:hypothetical protein
MLSSRLHGMSTAQNILSKHRCTCQLGDSQGSHILSARIDSTRGMLINVLYPMLCHAA